MFELPEHVLDYSSEALEPDAVSLSSLPPDTSFGQRIYRGTNEYPLLMNVVLMGADRSSLHKPQFCLEGQGWRINQAASLETSVHVERPVPYELPVVKLVADREQTVNGERTLLRGVYVYWFVADGAFSASISGFDRMWLMSKELFRTGVLQRWAYISCFVVCPPGREDAEFERMKTFIAAAAPDFQLTPRLPATMAAKP